MNRETESSATPHAFHVLAKPVGSLCNMECRYCFYLEKARLYPGVAQWTMSLEVLESFIRQYLNCQDAPVVSFAWQGGEPTLAELDFFRRVVELQRRYADGKRVENALQTNGILLDERWAEFLARHRFLVGLSIDGTREQNDQHRVDRGGRPSFERVMRALALLKRHGVEFNTLTVVSRGNGDQGRETYRFLREAGSRYMQFIPVVERLTNRRTPEGLSIVPPDHTEGASVAEWSVAPEQYGRFLCSVFEEWIRRDVGSCFVQAFDVALESWTGRNASLCTARRICGDAMVIEHNGDIYACDHFVFPEYLVGNILSSSLSELARSEEQERFGNAKADLPQICRKCDVLFACNGGCPKHRFVTIDAGQPRLSYLCAGFRLFYRHIAPYMRFMANELSNERAPANVMTWARARERTTFGGVKPRRTAPCPCGSGRIFKHCCGSSTARRSVDRDR